MGHTAESHFFYGELHGFSAQTRNPISSTTTLNLTVIGQLLFQLFVPRLISAFFIIITFKHRQRLHLFQSINWLENNKSDI